jgi:hypothetical protein
MSSNHFDIKNCILSDLFFLFVFNVFSSVVCSWTNFYVFLWYFSNWTYESCANSYIILNYYCYYYFISVTFLLGICNSIPRKYASRVSCSYSVILKYAVLYM